MRLETKMNIANDIRKLETNEIGSIQNHKETFIRIRTDFGAWSGPVESGRSRRKQTILRGESRRYFSQSGRSRRKQTILISTKSRRLKADRFLCIKADDPNLRFFVRK